MRHTVIDFGEKVEGYSVKVINERIARAASGLLLLPAIVSFMISYFTHDFTFTKIFVTVFMLDFFIRILINPKYAPSCILGYLFVSNQTPEYVGAAQKKFAWTLGLILAILMFFLIVIFEIMTPFKIIICLLCILLLFNEAAFGICIGCLIYRAIKRRDPSYCPGDSCGIKKKKKLILSKGQIFVLLVFTGSILVSITLSYEYTNKKNKPMMKCEAGKCGGK